MDPTNQYPLGISLSGGGARGIAHLGVLQALYEADIHPDAISGASAGSLMGVLYAAGKTPAEIIAIVRETSLMDMFQVSWLGTGFADLGKAKAILSAHIPTDDFSALVKPLFVSVTNLTTGQAEIISTGPLFEVILASCSIPLLFKPREINGSIYVDGGLMDNLPVHPLRRICRHVIGVNVTPIDREENLTGMRSIGYRALELILWVNVSKSLELCDFVIQPEADNYGLLALDKAEEIYQKGYEAAQISLEQIRQGVIPPSA
ncbi:MAG: patatin-like phospholipase family protein [Bacteroidota bacterium]